jgi:dihydroxyacid dehydratase/phosphogluconate dehydratase
MKMHSSKFRDPLISRAQPVTMIIPLVEEALRSAGIAPNRDFILDHFMNGQPRVAVVHGGDDHPPNLGMKETVRRVIRFIWLSDALPFEVAQSIPCEELSHGTDTASYGLLSRNFCAAMLAAQMEAHGYDAAIIIGSCDRMIAGNIRGLVETDFARQRRKGRPVFAIVLPSLIGRETLTSEADRNRFEPLRNRMSESDWKDLDDLLHRPLKPAVYAGIKFILDRCFHHRMIQESEKDDLERVIARGAGDSGAGCASSEASAVHRLMIASLGFVPRHCEITNKPVSDHQLSEPIKRLVSAVRKRERRVSVSSLVRSNLSNAASVWSASGGHPSWILHLAYLADAVGKKMVASDVIRRARIVPQILAIEEKTGSSLYAMSVESENGGNSGIDTVMRTLSEKRLIEDRANTLEGPWSLRIAEARSANGIFLHSTMTPLSKSCGMSSIQGNICTGAVVRVSRAGRNGTPSLQQFDQKIYLAAAYLGIRDFQADVNERKGIFERLNSRISREDLYDTWKLNWGTGASGVSGNESEMAHWSKAHLWDFLIERQLMRIIVVVAGIGPHAAGMPELQFTNEVVLTDGRVSWSHQGISIAHVVPEAFDDGPIAAIRTGDWIQLNLAESKLQVVCRKGRQNAVRPMTTKELMSRPDRKKRVNEIARQRLGLLPSFRIALDNVSSSESGVSPWDKSLG